MDHERVPKFRPARLPGGLASLRECCDAGEQSVHFLAQGIHRNAGPQQAAAFGQVDWKLNDQIKLTGGLRYTYDEKHGQEEARYIVFQDLSAATSAENLGSFLPAVDITPIQVSSAPDKGTCSAPTLQTTGKFAGDFVRCLKDLKATISFCVIASSGSL